MNIRDENLVAAEGITFDTVIIGGGVNGSCLYDRLCRQGYRVALLDKGDFGGGTSQASAMMVWGGLLYMGSLDFPAVFGFSKARDRMIRETAKWVSPQSFRFLPASQGIFSKGPVFLALYLYWLIGRFQRRQPAMQAHFPEEKFLSRQGVSLLFEEGRLKYSDARFTLHWIMSHRPPNGVAINHTELLGGEYHASEGLWHLVARDRLGGKELLVRAKSVANCAGVWTDKINATFSIRSPFKHVLSKGVFLGFKRLAEQQCPLIFDMEQNRDVITSIPWGPIELWGPTETAVSDIEEGFSVKAEDIRFLLEHRKCRFSKEARKQDIVSLRVGLRPLAVKASFDRDCYPLELSRWFRVVVDPERPWISTYGGKITGCMEAAALVARRLAAILPSPDSGRPSVPAADEPVPLTDFPGLGEMVPTLEWCMRNEFCCTLEDYLRRRTNVAQWIPREGLGRNDENAGYLRKLSLGLAGGDSAIADRQMERYREGVAARFDSVLEKV